MFGLGTAITGAKAFAAAKGLRMPGSVATKNALFSAAEGAIGGGIIGAYRDDSTFLGGAIAGAFGGAALPSALKYTGIGMKKAGMAGIARSWGGKFGLSEKAATSLITGGNELSHIGSNYMSGSIDMYKKAYKWGTGSGWGMTKSVVKNSTLYAGMGAAAGAAGWVGADIAGYGAGVQGIGKPSLLSAMGKGAMWGLGGGWGMKGLSKAGSGVFSVSHSKFMGGKNMQKFQGGLNKTGTMLQTVSESKLLKGAIGAAAVSQGVKMTRPVNRN